MINDKDDEGHCHRDSNSNATVTDEASTENSFLFRNLEIVESSKKIETEQGHPTKHGHPREVQ